MKLKFQLIFFFFFFRLGQRRYSESTMFIFEWFSSMLNFLGKFHFLYFISFMKLTVTEHVHLEGVTCSIISLVSFSSDAVATQYIAQCLPGHQQFLSTSHSLHPAFIWCPRCVLCYSSLFLQSFSQPRFLFCSCVFHKAVFSDVPGIPSEHIISTFQPSYLCVVFFFL